MKTCTHTDCKNIHYGLGLCYKHYRKLSQNQKTTKIWSDKNPESRKKSTQKYRQSEKGKETVKIYEESPSGRYARLKSGAKSRKIGIDLSLEEYTEVFDKGFCYYCDNPVGTGYALDRLNNDLSYSKTNVVTCCGTCNNLRGNYLSSQETIEVVKLLKQLRNKENIWE